MNSDLWVGAATTLAGAVLGGAISLTLNRQLAKDARAQRAEDELREKYTRSVERRLAAYSDFLTHARSYRDAIRPYNRGQTPNLPIQEIDALARAVDAASALVFLVLESTVTYEACRALMHALGRTQERIHSGDSAGLDNSWLMLSEEVSRLLREFQLAVRDELGISGVPPSSILSHRQRGNSDEEGLSKNV